MCDQSGMLLLLPCFLVRPPPGNKKPAIRHKKAEILRLTGREIAWNDRSESE